MKISILSFLALLTLSFSVSAKTIVISDIDDTIKMTGVLNSKISVGFFGIFGKQPFAGMSELYNEFDRKGVSIYYVSGSPQMIDCRIDSFLTEREFPFPDQRFLKDKISTDTYKFKTESIREILNQDPTTTAILIGDDTEHDPHVYDDISKEFPGRVEAIYIRAVQNAELPVNPLMKNFFSAVEIAAKEIVRGKLGQFELENVVHGFVEQTNDSGIQLRNFYCPKEGRRSIGDLISKFQTTGHGPIVELLVKTQLKIMKSCKNR